MDTIIKIVGTGTISTTTSGVATIDVPEDGTIEAIHGMVFGAAMADNDNCSAELSFLSTNQFNLNDARGAIAEVTVKSSSVTTSGQGPASAMQYFNFNPGIPINAGERLHLHTDASSGVTPTGQFTIYMRTSGGGRRARSRR